MQNLNTAIKKNTPYKFSCYHDWVFDLRAFPSLFICGFSVIVGCWKPRRAPVVPSLHSGPVLPPAAPSEPGFLSALVAPCPAATAGLRTETWGRSSSPPAPPSPAGALPPPGGASLWRLTEPHNRVTPSGRWCRDDFSTYCWAGWSWSSPPWRPSWSFLPSRLFVASAVLLDSFPPTAAAGTRSFSSTGFQLTVACRQSVRGHPRGRHSGERRWFWGCYSRWTGSDRMSVKGKERIWLIFKKFKQTKCWKWLENLNRHEISQLFGI